MAKGMTLADATAECERWFAYLQRSKDKAAKMAEIAGARRRGEIDEREGQRRVRALDNGVTVFDGANLEKAVRALLALTNKPRGLSAAEAPVERGVNPTPSEIEAAVLREREACKGIAEAELLDAAGQEASDDARGYSANVWEARGRMKAAEKIFEAIRSRTQSSPDGLTAQATGLSPAAADVAMTVVNAACAVVAADTYKHPMLSRADAVAAGVAGLHDAVAKWHAAQPACSQAPAAAGSAED